MKKRTAVTLLALAVGLVCAVNADDEQDYQGWMKTTVATAGVA